MRLKNRVFFLVLMMAVAAGLLVVQPARASVSVSFFYRSLAPYGDWITVSSYGRCWRPAHVAVGWQPYLDGEWIYTDAGWTWDSFDPWGGDPYHYGTWVFTVRYGWIWVPGTIWAPAWVTWCITDDAYGWAPVPPSLIVGTSGYIGPALTVSRSAYVFVPARQFAGVNAGSVRVPAVRNATLLARSRPLTRFAVRGGVLSSGGPAVSQVERAGGRRVQRVSLSRARTQAVPIRTSLSRERGRAPVVAPANERARTVGPRETLATRGRHEPAAHSAPPPPPHPKERHEMTGTQARLEPGQGRGNFAVHRQPAPAAREQRPPDAQPRPQGPPPPAHASPQGRGKHKEHSRD